MLCAVRSHITSMCCLEGICHILSSFEWLCFTCHKLRAGIYPNKNDPAVKDPGKLYSPGHRRKAKSVEQVPLTLIHRVLTIDGGERKSERLYDLIVTDMTKMPTLHYGFVSHARLPHAPFMLLQLCSAPRLEQARTAILWAQMIPCMEALSRTTVCLAMRRTREMLLELVKPMLHGVELPWIANVM